MLSFIKKDENESSSLWDWVILVAIIAAAGGFWFYYKYQKSGTLEGFQQADSLFLQGNYQQALDIYQNLQNSDYLEPAHDSILTERLDTIYQLLEEK